MITLSLLTPDTAHAFEHLTFASFRPLLSEASNGQVVALGATRRERPVGLALALKDPSTDSAELLSLFVAQGERRQGVGRALLARLEAELTAARLRSVQAVYTNGKASTPALESLLSGAGWSEPVVRQHFFRADLARLQAAPWIQETRAPKGYEIFPWTELSARDEADLRRAQQEEPWFPELLSPFQDADLFEAAGSVGLRHQGRVVGWMIAHRIAPNLLRYSHLFVAKEHQSFGRGVALVAAAVRGVQPAGSWEAICSVPREFPTWLKFVRRRIAPYTKSSYASLGIEKQLLP
ncbi:Acetyltransferase (GNAT) family protein [compost metagenome]